MMSPDPADEPHGLTTELRTALEAIPADEPRNYLRQSLQLLLPLLEQFHGRLQTLEARLEAVESGRQRRPLAREGVNGGGQGRMGQHARRA
jgi:hypothetical protein